MSQSKSETSSQVELHPEVLLAAAQTVYPPVASPSTDTFEFWEDILGNAGLKQVLQAFASQPFAPRNHILAYGANRSAKTCTVHLALQARFCRQRTASLNPCQVCSSCQRWRSGAGFRNGRYFDGKQSLEFQGVDCTDPANFDANTILAPRSWDYPLILFLDEVASPGFLPIIPRLYKPMTEMPITVLACAVRVKTNRDTKSHRVKQGLPQDFRFRFSSIEKTSTVAQAEFVGWLEKQCKQRSLQVDNPATLDLIYEKSFKIPGQALRPLEKAALLNVGITRDFIEDFRWDAE